MSQSRLHVLSKKDDPVGIAGALALFPIDAKVYSLHDAWQISPSIIVYSSIRLERGLRVPFKDLIALHFAKAVGDAIAVVGLLEDRVELEVDRFARDELALREGLVLLLQVPQLVVLDGFGLQVAHRLVA